jgi:hypothetical protein
MLIHLVLVTHGITGEELGGRLETGWVHAGRQAIRTGNTILDPSRPLPPSGVVDADVRRQPDPMMPAWALLHLAAASAVVGGGEAVLEGDLGDGLHPPVVRVQFLERTVGAAPTDAAEADDLAESLDDEGGADGGQLETSAGIAAQRLRGEWRLDGLDLILSQHIYTTLM